jgi:hypothetical protein
MRCAAFAGGRRVFDLPIDHVIYGVHDLDAAAARLNGEHGLGFIRGGRHPGGTANSVAPIEPPQYLELITVVDRAGENAKLVEREMNGDERFVGWAIAPDDLDAVAARLGIEPFAGSIENPDGSTGSWRILGDTNDSAYPFFIEYDGDAGVRRRRWAERRADAGNNWVRGVTFVEVGADPERMRAWIGDDTIPVRCIEGEHGVLAVGLATERGEIVLR